MTVRVRVCRDCCCGTRAKHPDVDHDALLGQLAEGTRGHAEVAVTTCLLACEESNVVVVSPGPYWFGGVLSSETVGDLVTWIRGGGPGTPVPPALARRRTRERTLESFAAGTTASAPGVAQPAETGPG